MTPANAFLAVDETLKKLTDKGLVDGGLSPKPEVTVGPLDRDDDGPRLNWFLYRIEPHPGFRNMEHPRTGQPGRRGAPPLAVQLHYLLTAYGAGQGTADAEQIIHVALASVMRRLHESPIVGDGSPFLPTPPPILIEPLRITLDTFDLESVSKIWTAATRPLRLSVSYTVSLVVVEAQAVSVTGPPVTSRRVVVSPSMGPRLGTPVPARVGGDTRFTVPGTGIGPDAAFRLAADPGDPAGASADGWPLTIVDSAGPVLRLPRNDLAPGVRRLDVTTMVEGLPVGTDSVALTVAPTVRTPPGSVAVGAAVTLATAHCAPDTELFLDAVRVATTAITPTSVAFTVPDDPGSHTVSLRSRHIAGDPVEIEVTP